LAVPFALLLAAAAAAAAAPLAEMVMRDSDHENLGEAVADYWEAQREAKDINKNLQALVEECEKVEKKFAKSLRDGDILSAVEDWSRILYHATESDDRGVRKGRTEEREYEAGESGTYSMVIHTPKKYSARTGPYPLLVCIPPKDREPAAHLDQDWPDPSARDEFIIAVCKMPTNERTWTELGSGAEAHGGLDTVMFTLRSVRETHVVDVDRIYLAGFGAGVPAAAEIAATFPHVFAGVVGRVGDLAEGLSPKNFRNLPTLFAGGGENCTSFQTRAKEEGIENVSVEAGANEADIWAWMREHARNPNPLEVTLAPRRPMNSQAFWLLVDRFLPEEEPWINARVDQEANTIHIESEGIGEATVFFNDAILDLSKPVKVVCNGQAREDQIPRLLKQLLDNSFASGDSGRVYVNRQHYDLTEPR
jgi:poly(3-hydroxybutyrate) depolymerase